MNLALAMKAMGHALAGDPSKLNSLLRTLLVLFLEFANDKERTGDSRDLETKPKFKFRRDFLWK